MLQIGVTDGVCNQKLDFTDICRTVAALTLPHLKSKVRKTAVPWHALERGKCEAERSARASAVVGAVRHPAISGARRGRLVWLKYPSHRDTGASMRDNDNPNPPNRTRPQLGSEVMSGIKPGRASGEWSGQIYSS